VTAPRPFGWDGRESHGVPEQIPSEDGAHTAHDGQQRLKIVVDDFGVKYNILRELEARGCDVIVVPAGSSADEIISHEPDGVLLSPGPGDPELLDRAVEAARALAGKTAIMGICLGHQVVARAFGAKTFKLKFGHRGGNHSVRDIHTGRVYVTAQNHGYAVSADDLPDELEVTHIDLSDGTVEGLRHRTLPIMTIQYHSEASPGPLDNEYLFDRFVAMVREGSAVGAE
jgi:carbamoyl-phosphate synthase small subunit